MIICTTRCFKQTLLNIHPNFQMIFIRIIDSAVLDIRPYESENTLVYR